MTDLPQLTKALAHTRETGGSRVLYRFTLNISGRTHTFDSLLDALGLTGRTGRPWPASQLLDAADYGAISARPRAWIPPQDLPQAARTGIEEEHKTSLFGWTDHVAHPRTGHVTAQNLDKTRRLLGKDIAQHCKTHDISSCWTTPDDPRAKHYDHRPTPPSWSPPATPDGPTTHR